LVSATTKIYILSFVCLNFKKQQQNDHIYSLLRVLTKNRSSCPHHRHQLLAEGDKGNTGYTAPAVPADAAADTSGTAVVAAAETAESDHAAQSVMGA
jgi:hypothetical protein